MDAGASSLAQRLGLLGYLLLFHDREGSIVPTVGKGPAITRLIKAPATVLRRLDGFLQGAARDCT
jgi:hypothetical protein